MRRTGVFSAAWFLVLALSVSCQQSSKATEQDPSAAPSPPRPLAPPSLQPPPAPSPSSGRSAAATTTAKGRTLRGAVLAANPSGLETLLESRLLADSRVTWVERTEIDKVLKEQSLQAMFAPDAISSRSKLGGLLHADVLVVTRQTRKEPRDTLELIVCETPQGLRLCSHMLPVAGSADATLSLAVDLVGQAIEKCGEEITEIWAVPPFLSDNLTDKQHSTLSGRGPGEGRCPVNLALLRGRGPKSATSIEPHGSGRANRPRHETRLRIEARSASEGPH